MSYNIYSFKPIFESGMQVFNDNDCVVTFSKGHSLEESIAELKEKDYDAIFTRTDGVSKELMDLCPNLKVISKQGVGLDNIDLAYAASKGIAVTYAPFENGNAVAEHAIFLMLAAARRHCHVDNVFRGGNFDVRYDLRDTYELQGKTLALFGCGNIGQRVATKAANGFGMRVIGYDPHGSQEKMKGVIELVTDRDEVIKQADFISLHIPSTPETRNSFGMAEFKKMKRTAIMINAGRGDVINEPELIQALKEGVILGAGLDVFVEEPLPASSPLLSMEQAFLTPHTAATTEEAIYRTALVAAQGVVDVLQGKAPEFPAKMR